MQLRSELKPAAAQGWFTFPRPNPKAKLRLFCFPYAGAGTNIYHRWSSLLPQDVEVCLVHLPGREHRLRERPFQQMSSLVTALERPLLPYLDKPLAFFGHSMGALVSFEMARQLRRRYDVVPARLFLSGCRAPEYVSLYPAIHKLPDAEFVDHLRRLNGLTGPMAQTTQLVNLMMPTIRADFKVWDTYSYATEDPLDCDIAAYGGFDDYEVGCEYLEAWRHHTTGRFSLHMFRGGHFFVHSSESLVIETLSDELTKMTAAEQI